MARGGKRKRPEKVGDVLGQARRCLASGQYRDTRHAVERQDERSVSRIEVRQAIEGGYHEKSKDEFKDEWQAWNYAVRWKTADRRELRIAISFDEEGWLLIITAIDLNR